MLAAVSTSSTPSWSLNTIPQEKRPGLLGKRLNPGQDRNTPRQAGTSRLCKKQGSVPKMAESYQRDSDGRQRYFISASVPGRDHRAILTTKSPWICRTLLCVSKPRSLVFPSALGAPRWVLSLCSLLLRPRAEETCRTVKSLFLHSETLGSNPDTCRRSSEDFPGTLTNTPSSDVHPGRIR